MQPDSAQNQHTPEDIDAVLGRFHAWAGARKPKEASDGVREISYEEALRSSRYRWHAPRTQSAPSAAPKFAPAQQDLGPEPGVIAVPSPEPLSEPATRPTAPEIEPPEADLAPFPGYAPPRFEPQAPDTASYLASKPIPRAESPLPRKKPASHASDFCAVLTNAVKTETVLPETAPATGLARTWLAPAEPIRQVSMSLRVSPSEQALIRVRAEEAGLSASAYLRQCALEVEQLRAQVHQAVAALERGSFEPGYRKALPASQPSDPVPTFAVSSPGVLGRIRRLFSGGHTIPPRE